MGYFDALEKFRAINLKELRPEGFSDNIQQLWEKKSSRVGQKHGWRPVGACPVCGSSKRQVEFPKYGIDIADCLDCTLRYASKIPQQTEDIYSEEEYLPAAQQCYMQNVDYRKNASVRNVSKLSRRLWVRPTGNICWISFAGPGVFLMSLKKLALQFAARSWEKNFQLGHPIVWGSRCITVRCLRFRLSKNWT